MKPFRFVRPLLSLIAVVPAIPAIASAEPVITEFMASNHNNLADDDGDHSDWVEIHNPDAAPLNLAGWYLTDSAKKKTKWQFPAVTLQPDSYLIVFASDKNRVDPARPLHTNFSLSADGEYLGLIKPDGSTVVSEFAPTFPAQPSDVSYGPSRATDSQPSQIGFFGTPTPGGPNGDASTLVLPERVVFSRASGLFTGSTTVQLSGAGPGEKIRYLIASPSASGAALPNPTSGSPEYTEPIAISGSVIITAAIFSSDDSRTGLPSHAQYVQLDPAGTSSAGTFTSQLPIIVLDNHGGGYLGKDGIDHPAWCYLFAPDETSGLAALAGTPALTSRITMTVRGAFSSNFPKKSFNLTFVDDLDRSNPQAPLALDSSEDWALVSPWFTDRAYIRNAYVYALSNSMGRWAPRTRFVEMFVNGEVDGLDDGDYAGIGVLTDRLKVGKDRIDIASLAAADVTAPAITGGYVIKIDNLPDDTHYSFVTDHGTPSRENTAVVVDTPNIAKLNSAQRDYIRGYVQDMENALVADRDSGWATRNYLNYIDLPSWVDHHILELFVGNVDALVRSDYFYKDRGGKIVSGPAWDFDSTMGSVDADNRNANWDTWSTAGPTDLWGYGWWGLLARDPEFMQAWVDRWQALRRDQFSNNHLGGLADAFAAQIGPDAAARDAARWGDDQGRYPGGFLGEVDHLKDWITNRAAWIDRQFIAPAAVSSDGTQIVVTPSAGALLAYTLDGSDPRATGGGLAPGARVTSLPITLNAGFSLNVRSYNPDANSFPGTPWSSMFANPGTLQNNDTPMTGGNPQDPGATSRLAALSSRGVVGTGENILIAGVGVSSSTPKRFLIRAVGPLIASLGVPNTVSDPTLRIIASDGMEVAANNGWETGPDAAQLPQLSAAIGITPFAPGSHDSAVIATLPGGSYSIQVASASGQTGVGLAEVYELDENGNAVALSTRGLVRDGEGILIGGIVVRGTAPKRVLIRGVGPSLASHGVGGVLEDPVLTLYRGSIVVGTNDDWASGTSGAQIPAVSAAAGTFAFTSSKDSALLVTLDPGTYTVQLNGKGGAEGVGLLEVYELSATP